MSPDKISPQFVQKPMVAVARARAKAPRAVTSEKAGKVGKCVPAGGRTPSPLLTRSLLQV